MGSIPIKRVAVELWYKCLLGVILKITKVILIISLAVFALLISDNPAAPSFFCQGNDATIVSSW